MISALFWWPSKTYHILLLLCGLFGLIIYFLHSPTVPYSWDQCYVSLLPARYHPAFLLCLLLSPPCYFQQPCLALLLCPSHLNILFPHPLGPFSLQLELTSPFILNTMVLNPIADKWCPSGDQCYFLSSLMIQKKGLSAPSANGAVAKTSGCPEGPGQPRGVGWWESPVV